MYVYVKTSFSIDFYSLYYNFQTIILLPCIYFHISQSLSTDVMKCSTTVLRDDSIDTTENLLLLCNPLS